MQIEDYFDFLAPDDIRIRGHRIGIETVLDAYLRHGMTAEKIQETWPTLTLEEVYATLLYYYANREQVQEYLAHWIMDSREAEEKADKQPKTPGMQRLLNIKAELQAYAPEERHTVLKQVIARHDAKQGQDTIQYVPLR